MKLYATVTSERASKGQGGNDFLEIRLKDGRENCFAVILVTKKEASFTPDIDLYSNGAVNVLETREEGFELERDIENLKGEKQKGEYHKCKKHEERTRECKFYSFQNDPCSEI